jgi:hypothetical protein
MRNIFILGLLVSLTLTDCDSGSKRSAMLRDSLLKDSISNTATLAKDLSLNTRTPADKKFVKTADLKFKVGNVLYATEKIEDITLKYGGYLTYSNLQNRNENYNNSKISRDSLLIAKQIVVENVIQLRIPNERLDSFIRELNPLVVFFDYRIIKLSDVTLQFIADQKKSDRLKKYDQRQSLHIDDNPGKLKETSTAEDKLLDRQNQADDLHVKSLSLEDQVKYCNLTINIYQKPIIIQEVIADFTYVSEVKPNFFIRVWDSIIQGWWILCEVLIFLIKLWGIALLVTGLIFGIKYLSKLYKKIK